MTDRAFNVLFLVEVPVMLSVVHLVRRSRGWYESKPLSWRK